MIPIRQIENTHGHNDPDLSNRFNIRYIQTPESGQGMVQELHRHDFYYLLALEKGAGLHEIDFIPYTPCSNSVFFMRPGQVHQLRLKTGSSGYLLQFRNEFYLPGHNEAGRSLRKASAVKHYCLHPSGATTIFSTLRAILQEFASRQEGYQQVIRAHMEILFMWLIRQQRDLHSSVTFNRNGKADLYAQEKLEAFLELMETQAFSHRQVSDYADMLHLSVYQLNAITRTTLSKTPSEIINEHLILEAKRLLLATSDQINQIAWQLGYEDPSYFIRFFKKHTGQSPEAFRSNQQ